MKSIFVIFVIFLLAFVARAEEVESMTSQSEADTEESHWHCTPYPTDLDVDTTCHNVQEWINDNAVGNYGQAQGCEDTEALSVAKSFLTVDDECFLDFATPYHGGAQWAISLIETANSAKSKLAQLKSKVLSTKAKTKGLTLSRDDFITRIEKALGCELDTIPYCTPPPQYKSSEECDFTDDPVECNDSDGCHYDTRQALCIPNCPTCGDEEPHSQWTDDSDLSHNEIVSVIALKSFHSEDCYDIEDRSHCENHDSKCQWVSGDDLEDEADHCEPYAEEHLSDYGHVSCGFFTVVDCSNQELCKWVPDTVHDQGGVCRSVDYDTGSSASGSGSSGSGSSDDGSNDESTDSRMVRP